MPFERVITLFLSIKGRDEQPDQPPFDVLARVGGKSVTVPFQLQVNAELLEAWQRNPLEFLDSTERREANRSLAELGGALFDAVFHHATLDLYRESFSQAETNDALLRIVLDLHAEAHFPLPWEGMHDNGVSRFLSTNLRTAIVRLLPDGDEKVPSLPRHTPLRILGVVSAPTDAWRLDTEEEENQLGQLLATSTQQGIITLDWLYRPADTPMISALVTRLREAARNGVPYDILHYIGHARYNPTSGEGELLFEAADRTTDYITGIDLGGALQESGLSLVILNACEGARNDHLPFRSVAAELVRRANIPLSIANQLRIRNRTATAFSSTFYTQLTQRASVEEAVMRARRAVNRNSVDLPEWVSSIFFTRFEHDEARLFPTTTETLRTVVLHITLLLLALVVGITTISLMRHYGLLAGLSLQVGFFALIGAMGFLLFDDIRPRWRSLLGVGVVATAIVGIWFYWQPWVAIATPPSGFALSILEPPVPPTLQQAHLTELVVPVEGEVAGMPADQHLWILVHVPDSSTYVVGGEATVEGNRFVARDVIVGPISTLKKNGAPYILQPVLVDERGHAFMQEHQLQRWRIFHPDFKLYGQPTLPITAVRRR